MSNVLRLLHVVGARPNLPKLAPVHRAAAACGLAQVIIHTGQHYDDQLSGIFFRELGIPSPDVDLKVGSYTHAVQTARVMERLEPVLHEQRPDWVIVYGDVNSTMAAALVASKLCIRVAHVEAGLRSFDRSMPEEINRIVTDRLADLLLTPSRDASDQLLKEGEPPSEIAFVGNVMVDSILHAVGRFGESQPLSNNSVVVTMHRPSNVDDPDRLRQLVTALQNIAAEREVVFPMHPRTADRLSSFMIGTDGIKVSRPLGYFDMLRLVRDAHAVVTDSGGLQEETTALGVPCFTVRDNTERPITVQEGTNRLVRDPAELPELVHAASRSAGVRRPEGWDGKAGERAIAALLSRSSRS